MIITEDVQVFIPKSVRIFVSHSHKDVVIATWIKRILEAYFGFEVFVAHEDLAPTSIWSDKILEELTATDIVIALLTEDFKNSDFADQECGHAIALNKFIIPTKIKINPYGFLSKIQALQFKLYSDHIDSWITFCKRIVEIIRDQPQFYNKVTDLQIQALRNSPSFDTTKKVIDNLPKLENMNESQLNEILKIYCSNGQVSGEKFRVPYFMKNLMENYKSVLDGSLVSTYEAL